MIKVGASHEKIDRNFVRLDDAGLPAAVFSAGH
jgi:hypothetical protein